MADVLEYIPLFQEDAVSVRARMDADANAGLTIEDPRWIDTREGTFYWDVTQVAVLEFARLWDSLAVEVPAVATPLFAWGTYLERHAEVFGLSRKPAVFAGGSVNFVGTAGAVIPTGSVVSAESEGEDAEPIEFVVTEPGTIGEQLAPPTGLAATPSSSGGTLSSASYFYRVTAFGEFGETTGSEEVSAAVTGPAGSVALDWADVVGADGYRVYRAVVAAEDGVRIYEGAASAATDSGQSGTIIGPPDTNTTAGVALPVEAVEPGTKGNVAARAITSVDTPNPDIDDVINPLPMTGGLEEETDEALRDRILAEFEGQGGGNQNDYQRWALTEPGVGKVFVNPVWDGPGTVQVVVMTEAGDPVSQATIDSLQQTLDPVPGKGSGLAPIGATVTVQTPVQILIDVAGSVTFRDGYSLDGTGGTTPTREEIVTALRDYIDSLDVGEDVIYDHVKAQFFTVEGVYTVAGVTVNGGTVDIPIDVTSDPPQVAKLDGVALA